MACIKRTAIGCLSLLAIFVLGMGVCWYHFFCGSWHHEKTIEPLNMRFDFQRTDSTLILSFGDKESEDLTNRIECILPKDCGGTPFYFLVYNRLGKPEVKYIFFEPQKFFDIHITDYKYRVRNLIFAKHRQDIDFKLKYFPVLKDYSKVPDNYYIVKVQVSPFAKDIDFSIYNLGIIDDVEYFIETLIDCDALSSFSKMKKEKTNVGYDENIATYGAPRSTERYALSVLTKRELMQKGWIFLDTIEYNDSTVLEINKWDIDSTMLTIIYRIEQDSIRIPLNGSLYRPYLINNRNEIVYYQ